MMPKGGASLAPYYEFENQIPDKVKATVEKLTAQILTGSFTVDIIDTEPKSSF
jgi:basic membrane protein A